MNGRLDYRWNAAVQPAGDALRCRRGERNGSRQSHFAEILGPVIRRLNAVSEIEYRVPVCAVRLDRVADHLADQGIHALCGSA